MVEWKKLGEVCETITPPKKLTKENYLEKGLYPIIDQGQSNVVGYTDDESTLLENNEYVLFGDHTRYVKYFKGNFAQGADGLKILRAKKSINTKYFYYTFQNTEVPSRGYSRHWSIAKDILIPIPSLSEQVRIVSILDTFTASIDNIKAQIEQRRKQYEHYRNTLLTFNKDDDSVEWKTLGEVGEIIRGNGLQKTDFVEEGVGCVHYGQIYTRLGFSLDKTLTFVPKELAEKLTTVEPGNLIIACTSENIEDICKSVVWLGNENIVTGGHACVFKHHENPKYIGYCFLTHDFFNQKKKYAYGAKVIDIKTEKLSLIQIPLPSLQEQQRIVSILDTFEASITNLEAQLEQKQKQYEYYREKLLTFE